jgi:hypothetical protein
MRSLDETIKVLTVVFGFMWQQPLPVTLRQLRIIQVALIVNSQYLLWVIVGMLHSLDPVQAAMAYATIAVTLVGSIWKCIDSFNKGTVKDE